MEILFSSCWYFSFKSCTVWYTHISSYALPRFKKYATNCRSNHKKRTNSTFTTPICGSVRQVPDYLDWACECAIGAGLCFISQRARRRKGQVRRPVLRGVLCCQSKSCV